MVEKIEKKEKEEVRKVKKLELEEEKQKRLMVAKLHGTLYKHKEALKREILKKRSLMEKNLQQEIQVPNSTGYHAHCQSMFIVFGFPFFWFRCCSLHCSCDVFVCFISFEFCMLRWGCVCGENIPLMDLLNFMAQH